MATVPTIRIRLANDAPLNPDGDYVLYWMIAARRTHWNFALERAVHWAKELKKPLVVFESLRVGYPWASDRLHRFVLEGMADSAARLAKTPAHYYPYVEPKPDADKGLLKALAAPACLVVTDDYPAFFLPHMIDSAARRIAVCMEAIDSNGILPLRATDRAFPTAYAFRRFLQKNLREHLATAPTPDPLTGVKLPRLAKLPDTVARRWPVADLAKLLKLPAGLAKLPIDHTVPPAAFAGGAVAASRLLKHFVTKQLANYGVERNQPELEGTSGFSPYLHFGHLSPHEIFSELAKQARWSAKKLAATGKGQREGWWGVDESSEGFLDELITWRELGYNMATHRPDYEQYESLPEWAQATLAQHARDKREFVYTLEEFERGQTHDPLWNAAQMQLVREGRLHNYLRMLWGKKILEWTASPRDALAVMIELNNKYAIDGRDPNSYSGIFWVLGRYDRAWGPERKIFGKIRYMSSENTARKVSVRRYIAKYAPDAEL